MSELANVDDDPTTRVPGLDTPEERPPRRSGEPDELLLVRAAWGMADDGLEARLRETGLTVRPGVPCDRLIDDTHAEPPSVIVLDLEPFEHHLLEFARRVRQALSQNCPAILAVMKTDDEALLEVALGAGVLDVIDPAATGALLRVKVLRFARKRARARSIGGYTIQRVLGRGGMGVVYAAERDGERFALKVLETGPNTDGEALVRFRREMEALRTLAGPGIPRFYEAGRTQDCFFYVMELVEGRTLHEIAHEGAVSEELLRRIASDIADALRAIHRAGFVHRDIKPGNVIISPSGRATLIDYGLTKLMDDLTLTKNDEIFGTLHYIAPEILRGTDASPASDAYALGMTLFHAALGESPLEGSANYLANRILTGSVPRPAEKLLSRYSPAAVSVLEGLLERDPAKRFAVGDVRRFLADPGAARAAADAATGDERALELTLRFATGMRTGQAVTFTGPRRLVLGRAADCDVPILDADVSRRHCSITIEARGAHVKDLASANGTELNGERIGLAALQHGDRLRIADTELVVELAPSQPTARIRNGAPRRTPRPGADVVREASDPDSALEVPGFELIRPIGSAGSTVFEARKRGTEEHVAIKILRSRIEVSAGSRARFLREAETASALVHPNVVRVLARGEAACGLYLVMELVKGETLRALVARQGPLAVPSALGVARQVASALELARTCGVVHRDVKPENILVQPDGVAKLADFGLAKRALAAGEDALTHRGDVLGTIAYMAPEQLTDATAADHRADIYSLGATLYHALAGAPPFGGKTAVECFKHVLSDDPPSLAGIRADIPPIVLGVVSRCLAKKREDRYQSAGELERVLATLLASAADRRTVS